VPVDGHALNDLHATHEAQDQEAAGENDDSQQSKGSEVSAPRAGLIGVSHAPN
jgi:hypothetical protein